MTDNPWRVASPATREWPQLRDLVLAAGGRHQSLDLTCAVADAPRPAVAWRERLAELVGTDRFARFVRDADGTPHGFVAAYRDGEGPTACVVVRHFVALPTDAPTPGEVLLAAVEDWAVQGHAREVLFEVLGEDPALELLLSGRGYAPGAVRPPTARPSDDVPGISELPAVEWVLDVTPAPRVTGLFAAARRPPPPARRCGVPGRA